MTSEPPRRRWLPLARNELGLVAAIAVVWLLTAIFDQQHTYVTNPKPVALMILRQTTMLGIFALGAALVIVSGGIDLSCGSMIAFGGTTCATLMLLMAPEEMPSRQGHVGLHVIALAIAGTLVVGFLVGSMHAWLITMVGLPPFVATLATLVGLRSLGRAIIENVTKGVIGRQSTQIQIYDSDFLALSKVVWIRVAVFLALALVVGVLLSRTVIGRHLYALGGNEQAARLSGIHTDRLKWLAYATSAMLSSVAGIIYISEQSVADPQTLGRGYELNAIAAAVVGGCSLQGGVGTIQGTVLGCLFLRIVIDGIAKVIKSGADVYEGLIVGIVVAVAVALNQLRIGAGRQMRFFDGALGWVTVVNLGLMSGVLTALLAGAKAGGIATFAALTLLVAFKIFESRRNAPIIEA
jgi:ribose/xylose/arabinose/galactoside ABC-type transport system permease subunit